MKLEEAREYVIENGRYAEDAPQKPYFVRFPTPHASKVFFSDDTEKLAQMVFRFGNTKKGRELWARK